jgi:hypothetical protein
LQAKYRTLLGTKKPLLANVSAQLCIYLCRLLLLLWGFNITIIFFVGFMNLRGVRQEHQP